MNVLREMLQVTALELFLILLFSIRNAHGMFERLNWLENIDTRQRNYGVAVANVDMDESDFEWVVAGFSGQNFVLKFNTVTKKLENIAKPNTPYDALRDVEGKAIGVCACDIDGDGREEIYFLNTNQAYAGRSSYGDKLFKWRNGRYVDILSEHPNDQLDAKNFAGRSVACVDRKSSGRYAIAVATYSREGSGKFALIEMDESHPMNSVNKGYIVLKNVAREANINKATGGRGIAVGPLLGHGGHSDIFFNNEGNSYLENQGQNFLFKSMGNGSYFDLAFQVKIKDENQNGRGVCLTDLNKDSRLDIVYGNWEGNHRIFVFRDKEGRVFFENIATTEFEQPSLIRTVICEDFDNDGHIEIFMNNIYSQNNLQPNRLFKAISTVSSTDPEIVEISIDDALEEEGCGTGAAVGDIDHDGWLELLISHGEDRPQPLQVYRVSRGNSPNHWLRVYPKTKFDAPARGAKVIVLDSGGQNHTHVIDGGSGYLCQMEPVAHVGLGSASPVQLTVHWPDGIHVSRELTDADLFILHTIDHPSSKKKPRMEIKLDVPTESHDEL